MTTYTLGTLTATPISRTSYTVTEATPTDVFAFNITETRTINLGMDSLNGFFGDTKLSLYQDVNENGVLDSADQLLTRGVDRSFGGGGDEGINVTASAGSYLAQVARGHDYSIGGSSPHPYNLKLSATALNAPSNVVPSEIQVGSVGYGASFTGQIDNTNTADVYAFSCSGVMGITLSGLSANANIRLIKDINSNGLVDAGEVLGSSTNAGTAAEALSVGAGSYLLQVYKGGNFFGSGNTPYNLQFSSLEPE